MMTILLVIVAAAWTQLKAHALWALVVIYGGSCVVEGLVVDTQESPTKQGPLS
jgi:hypothetical protein